MKTKARLVAESVRLKQWGEQICGCQNDGWLSLPDSILSNLAYYHKNN